VGETPVGVHDLLVGSLRLYVEALVEEAARALGLWHMI
jgi:hypothetical protein